MFKWPKYSIVKDYNIFRWQTAIKPFINVHFTEIENDYA